MIEYKLLLKIMKYSKCPSYPLLFYTTHIINTFQGSAANHDKLEGQIAHCEILLKVIVFLL